MGYNSTLLATGGIDPRTNRYLGDDDENDDDEGEGDLDGTMPGGSGKKFVPVIMLAAVAGLMLLIIPAYYGTTLCTKRRERRKVERRARAEALTADEATAAELMVDVGNDGDTTHGESSDSCCSDKKMHNSSSSDEGSEKRRRRNVQEKCRDGDHDGQSDYCEKGEFYLGTDATPPVPAQDRTVGKDQRRDSAASSMTLVDEPTGRRLDRSCRHQHHRHSRHHRRHCHPRRRSNSPQQGKEGENTPTSSRILIEDADEEEEEELARIKNSTSFQLEYQRQQSLDPSGASAESSVYNSRKNSRQQSVITLFGGHEGSSRNGSTSESSPVSVSGLDMSGTYFDSTGPKHPFDHHQQPEQQQQQRRQQEQPLMVPESQFCMSPMSSPSVPRIPLVRQEQQHQPGQPQ